MKIPLRVAKEANPSSRTAQTRLLERDIMAAKRGDWNAKNNLVRTFTPLLTSLAQKRSADTAEVNRYIEAGKNGLFTAVAKYKQNIGPEKFRVFALDFIEKNMDRAAGGKGEGFFSRLFGGS
jgi:DNA-directed RNA polymerase specialized sigma subunit